MCHPGSPAASRRRATFPPSAEARGSPWRLHSRMNSCPFSYVVMHRKVRARRFRHGASFRNRLERITRQRRPAYHLFQSVADWVIFSGRRVKARSYRRWRLLMATQTRPEGKARSFGENIESDLASRFLRVVEVAAIASARTMGQGERKLSDQVATEAMRHTMDFHPHARHDRHRRRRA